MPNTAMKVAVDVAYQLHLDLTVEERKDYSRVREAAIESPDDTMTIIIDGMDQITTYVPKFRQSVKGIESRYVKNAFMWGPSVWSRPVLSCMDRCSSQA
jgi:hypothetical protein